MKRLKLDNLQAGLRQCDCAQTYGSNHTGNTGDQKKVAVFSLPSVQGAMVGDAAVHMHSQIWEETTYPVRLRWTAFMMRVCVRMTSMILRGGQWELCIALQNKSSC